MIVITSLHFVNKRNKINHILERKKDQHKLALLFGHPFAIYRRLNNTTPNRK